MPSSLLLLALIACADANGPLDPKRVHLVDAYPKSNPTNFFFRTNNPIAKGADFNFSSVIGILNEKAQAECNTTLPMSGFKVYDLDLENPTDPGFFKELEYWNKHPDQGQAGTDALPGAWMTLGSLLEPKYLPKVIRDAIIKNGTWAVQGKSDHLPERIAAARALITDTSGPPKIIFAHCNAGCDRTGEFIGAYALSHLGYNITTAYGEACKQCGRCPNYFATMALGWWCLTLQESGAIQSSNCLDFAGCTVFKDCDAHSPTPLTDDCPH
jgi:hypothetical protein